jgi:hypothetical protein
MIGGVFGEFLAMVVGFVIMAGLISVVTALLPRLLPDWVELDGSPRGPLIATNLTWSFVAAAMGGYVASWIADANPLDTALALAIVMLVLGAIGTLQSRQKYPLWYKMLLLVFTPIGVLAGGLLRMKFLGLL